MDARDLLVRALEVAFVAVLVALVAGQLLGQPVLLSYVETGSMEPALEPGDGFVAVPSAAAGDVEAGDVIVFEAQTLDGGGLTTHRVVGVTDEGYVTKGDANPFTDQDGGEPPVSDGQVVATALQVNGRVLVVPGLGTATVAVQDGLAAAQRSLAEALGTRALLGSHGLALLVAGVGLLVLGAGLLFDGDGRRARTVERTRERTGVYDARRAILAMALFVAVVSGATTFAASGSHEFGMVSASFQSESPTTVPTGESRNLTFTAVNGGQVPMYAFFAPASENVDVSPRTTTLDRGGRENVTVTLQAPPRTGYYPQYVTERRYLAVIPRGAVAWLHGVHPWLPVLATSATVGVAFLVAGLLVVGASPIRTRSRRRTARS